MSDRMRPLGLQRLVQRALAELTTRGSIFDIPVSHFWQPARRSSVPIFGASAENPLGPAAGPHTQLAQNILCAWLAGGRCIELKTVQRLDSLVVEKPCIDAADEGYNVEWSTELSLEQAFDEYLKGWILLHLFETLLGPQRDEAPGEPGFTEPGFLFTMSVGYDLEGIKSDGMDRFIRRLMDCGEEPLFHRYQEELGALVGTAGLLSGTPWSERAERLRALPSRIPSHICASVTLSTMHGCPPSEIEAICTYLMADRKLDTLVKLNPTLLGLERVRSILDRLGYDYVTLNPAGFAKDLPWSQAVPMLRRLQAVARRHDRFFGVKVSNTLAAANNRGVLPGAEMYLSGRALYPVTVSLAADIAREFSGELPISFSGGVSEWNAAALLDAGIRPLTVATEILKPGGYSRLKGLAEMAEAHSGARPTVGTPKKGDRAKVDPALVSLAAEAALRDPCYTKAFRGARKVRVDGALPLVDCFVAPCVQACPIHQDVPTYIHLAGAGEAGAALDAILSRNPLPFMTGHLCDHPCTENCTRKDWEGAVRIREAKRIAAEAGYPYRRGPGRLQPSRARGVKAAIIGAGPAGLAAAALLAREGFEVTVFERESEPGGIVRHVVPDFRIPLEALRSDLALITAEGIRMQLGQACTSDVRALQESGFRYVLVAIGAEAERRIGIEGERTALQFLRQQRASPERQPLGRSVVVVGGGDTAMDAARAARRCPGVKEVSVVYRRTRREMPASVEELEAAVQEGIRVHYLRSPAGWAAGLGSGLVFRIMQPGPVDETGRATSVPTGSTQILPADTLISAAGSAPDAQALGMLGLAGPAARPDPDTLETGTPGVFLIGDAATGPATIVRAIASARRAADAILSREGGSRLSAPALPHEDATLLRAARDRLLTPTSPKDPDPVVRERESRRCLGCDSLCLKCVEVCPNRANTAVRVPGLRDAWQIVHLDALCNECGNCATFCPWDGRPYRDKLTLFETEEDFRASDSPGFYVKTAGGPDGKESFLVRPADSPSATAVLQAIVRDHPWLLGSVKAAFNGPDASQRA